MAFRDGILVTGRRARCPPRLPGSRPSPPSYFFDMAEVRAKVEAAV